jgi:hypothetical protein
MVSTTSTVSRAAWLGKTAAIAIGLALALALFCGAAPRAQAAQMTCQDDSKIYGCWEFDRWVPDNNSVYSGGSQTNVGYGGRSAGFSFTGTSIKWITSKGPAYGKTAVYVDGTKVKLFDGYASGYSHRVVGFSRSGLADKKHTIKILDTGNKDANATGRYTGIDAFVVDGTTVQDTSPRITYGLWRGVTDSRASGGTYRISSAGIAHKADSFTFTGPSVTFVTATGPNMSQKAAVGVMNTATGATVQSNWYDLRTSSLSFQRTITFSGLSTGKSYDLFVYSGDGSPVVFDAVQANYVTP